MSLRPLLVVVLLLAACGSSATSGADGGTAGPDAATTASDAAAGGVDAATPGDASSTDAATPIDAATPPDASLPEATESEPNNGNTASETNLMAVPSKMSGAIDPAEDLDIFEVNLTAGDFLVWTLSPGGAMSPHLAITEAAQKVPNLVSRNAVLGAPALQEHFVLSTGKYYAIVRDARNVGTPSGRVGGPAFTYGLSVIPTARAPITVALPSTTPATLSSRSAVGLFLVKSTSALGFDAEIYAARKTPRSDLDSRLSLFDVARKKWLITNDDVSASITDSKVGGALPAGDYLVVVENVSAGASDLSYELRVTAR